MRLARYFLAFTSKDKLLASSQLSERLRKIEVICPDGENSAYSDLWLEALTLSLSEEPRVSREDRIQLNDSKCLEPS